MSNPYIHFLNSNDSVVRKDLQALREAIANKTPKRTIFAFERAVDKTDKQLEAAKALIRSVYDENVDIQKLENIAAGKKPDSPTASPAVTEAFVAKIFDIFNRLEEAFYQDELWQDFFQEQEREIKKINPQLAEKDLRTGMDSLKNIIAASYLFRLVQAVFSEFSTENGENSRRNNEFYIYCQIIKQLGDIYFFETKEIENAHVSAIEKYKLEFENFLERWEEMLDPVLERQTGTRPLDKIKTITAALGKANIRKLVQEALKEKLKNDSNKRVEYFSALLSVLDDKKEQLETLKQIKSGLESEKKQLLSQDADAKSDFHLKELERKMVFLNTMLNIINIAPPERGVVPSPVFSFGIGIPGNNAGDEGAKAKLGQFFKPKNASAGAAASAQPGEIPKSTKPTRWWLPKR